MQSCLRNKLPTYLAVAGRKVAEQLTCIFWFSHSPEERSNSVYTAYLSFTKRKKILYREMDRYSHAKELRSSPLWVKSKINLNCCTGAMTL